MHQAQRGYPPLLPQEVVGSGPDVPLDYYTVDGRPALNYVYEMKGSEGEKYVLPLEEFDWYLLVMVDAIPKDVELSITGKLRTDVRAVQRAPSLGEQEGGIDGPFLREYRDQYGLPDNAKVYFLDTGQRAAINVSSVAGALVPLYFFLLFLSQPIRRDRPSLGPKRNQSR